MNLQALDLMLGQKGTVNPKELSPLALAYIGDAVYEMLVRTTVLTGGNAPVNRQRYGQCKSTGGILFPCG